MSRCRFFTITSHTDCLKMMRIRVKVARSTMGVVSHELSVEGPDRERGLSESDRVYAELERRYPQEIS